ncbi:MAG: AAA family ATPase [Saprospiraceae bacterium]|nr:AAA family ATPase [Saprospiraceae bacterium]
MSFVLIILDQIKGVRLLVSGSSSFELANEINEPLTGRKWEYTLLPFSTGELVAHHGALASDRYLLIRRAFGRIKSVRSEAT